MADVNQNGSLDGLDSSWIARKGLSAALQPEITNTWLRVTVVANTTTGLQANDVFYFGHVLADVNIGNTPTRYRVNASDVSGVREHQSIAANSVGITNIYDLNRDGRVNATDVSIVRENQQIAGIVGPLTVPGQ